MLGVTGCYGMSPHLRWAAPSGCASAPAQSAAPARPVGSRVMAKHEGECIRACGAIQMLSWDPPLPPPTPHNPAPTAHLHAGAPAG